MQIDQATEADIPALCRLLAQLFEQEAEFQADEDTQRRGLARILANPEVGQILLARREQRVIGMVSLLYTVSTALGERVAWLEDMVVDKRCRGAGVGSALLKHAVELAKSRGCRRITLLSDGDNLAGRIFYQRHGFKQSAMVPLRLSLDDI